MYRFSFDASIQSKLNWSKHNRSPPDLSFTPFRIHPGRMHNNSTTFHRKRMFGTGDTHTNIDIYIYMPIGYR